MVMMMIVLLKVRQSGSDSGTQHNTDQQTLVHVLWLVVQHDGVDAVLVDVHRPLSQTNTQFTKQKCITQSKGKDAKMIKYV